MPITLLMLAVLAATIYFACEYFVNGVEWLGDRLGFSETATGTILAAFGTALPESAVTAAAVLFGHNPGQKDIGIGAAVGGPLVLSTISYGVVGATLILGYRRLGRPDTALVTDCLRLSGDQGWFLVIFACKVALGLMAFAWKPWLAIPFLLAYALYLRREIGESHDDRTELLEPLRLHPRGTPSMFLIVLQTAASLLVIAAASRAFVDQLGNVAAAAHLQPQFVALLLSPVATELPETMNAVIWVRQGKERLALANISGSMMIQATIPAALGIAFSSWIFSNEVLAAAVVTQFAIFLLWLLFRRGHIDGRSLAPVSALYAVFVAAIAAIAKK